MLTKLGSLTQQDVLVPLVMLLLILCYYKHISLSGGPEEIPGGRILANPGLSNGSSPSTPTTQVKGLRAYAMLLKLNTSSQLS